MKRLILGLGLLVLGCKTAGTGSGVAASDSGKTNVAAKPVNGVLMQYFHWYVTKEDEIWKKMAKEAKNIGDAGITALWLPPAYKGTGGENDVGYGVYDLYDLGEFDQHGSVRTKYGTKDDYIKGIAELHKFGVQSYADVVLNHRFGADSKELVKAVQVRNEDRNSKISGLIDIEAYTKFDFPGRKDKYSGFRYNWTHFKGTDWDATEKEVLVDGKPVIEKGRKGLYLFEGKAWNQRVEQENGNYDYLMASDVDFDNRFVRDELIRWGRWYVKTTGIDGVRIDAVKHIDFSFWGEFLDAIRKEKGADMFAVGEYLNMNSVDILTDFVHNVGDGNRMHVFDFPLHSKFHQASAGNGNFDMASLFDKGSVMGAWPQVAVTFVENHDTQPCQAFGTSAVNEWFKPLAYAFILVSKEGYPNIFYPDYYGMDYKDGNCSAKAPGHRAVIDKLLAIRRDVAFGGQINYGNSNDYNNSANVVGISRDGGDWSKGLAMLINDNQASSRWMKISERYANQRYCDVFSKDCVTLNKDGWAEFKVPGGGLSIYVSEDDSKKLNH